MKTTSSNSKHKKYKLKSSTSSTYLKKRLNKYKYFRYRHTTHNHMQLNSLNTTLSPNRTNNNKINNYNYKLPILTRIELVPSNDETNQRQSTKTKILFNDYLLISSKTKYKYLLYSLFEQVNLLSKQNYSIVDGFVQINNWEPIGLNSISSIVQCFDKSASSYLVEDSLGGSTDNKQRSSRSVSRERNVKSRSSSSNSLNSSVCTIESHDNFDESDFVSVYDIFKQVLCFISISIQLKLNDKPSAECETQSKKICSQESLVLESQKQKQEPEENEQDDNKQTNRPNPTGQISKPNPSANTSNTNLASNLNLFYSNSQLVSSMFPFLNLNPIFSHLLNGLRKNDPQMQQVENLKKLSDTNSHLDQVQTTPGCSSSSALSIETTQFLPNSSIEPKSLNNYTSPSSNSSSSASSTSSSFSHKPVCSLSPNALLNYANQINKAKLNQFSQNSPPSSSSKEKKQRERTTFDPQEEISRLMHIFEKTHHPTRHQIANICEQLNSLACRKDKKPLEPYNIQYWFKNARAALRRKSKGDTSTCQNKTTSNQINELESNEDSKNSFEDFDDFGENNTDNLDNSDFFQNQLIHGAKQESYVQEEDVISSNGVETQIHKNYSTNSLSQNCGSARNGNRRNRVFIDPITEVPILEQYFSVETYPDHYLIEKICDTLNKGEYRYKFPKLEARNIQLWFKNHRAKLKRLKMTPSQGNMTQSNMSNPNCTSNNNNEIVNLKTSFPSGKFFTEKEEDLDNEEFDDYDYGDYGEQDENRVNSQ